ncbi:MAG: hypothetical protein AAFQ27_06380, partial [Pseudomonadota bacterium]
KGFAVSILRISAATILAGFVLNAPASAQQSLFDHENMGRSDVRVSVSVTIPLGGLRKDSETTPRVNLDFQNRRIQQEPSSSALSLNGHDDPVNRPRPLASFTLERNPRLLMNGHRVVTFGPRSTLQDDGENEESSDGGGIGTGTAILIGVGATLGVFVWAAAETADEIEDLADPD